MKNSRDRLIFRGIVVEANRGIFKVKLDDSDSLIRAELAGKLSKHKILIVQGDRVEVEICPYDMVKGRILVRL